MVKLEYETIQFRFPFGVYMSFSPSQSYDIAFVQKVKMQKKLATFEQAGAFHNAVTAYNSLTSEDQYAGDGSNGGQDGVRVDIFVDPRRPVIHVEVDALGDHPKFFRCEVGGDIVIQEVAL